MIELKQLNKAYLKRFSQLDKKALAEGDTALLLFIEYLKYMRDVRILTLQSTDSVITLSAAIAEFELYKNTKKDCYWNNFCEFLRLNIKEWFTVNDPV